MPLRGWLRRHKRFTRGALCAGVTLVVLTAAVAWYASSDDLPQSAATRQLESIMPTYDVQEVHSMHINAPPATTYAAILAVTPGEIALARPLLWIRTLPGRLTGGGPVDDATWNRPLLSSSTTAVLHQIPDNEVIIGLIGEFWKLRGGRRVMIQSPDHFRAFNDSGFAVSTLSFHIAPEENGCQVTTVTRVRTTDAESRRAFLRYWRIIGTGSAVLRRTWLRAIKARAEREIRSRSPSKAVGEVAFATPFPAAQAKLGGRAKNLQPPE